MKKNRIYRILAIAVVLSLLILAVPAIPAQALPTISIYPISGPSGTLVQLTTSGEAFPYNTIVSIYLGGIDMQIYPSTGSNGLLSTSFYIPANTTPGAYPISLYYCPYNTSPPCTAPLPIANVATFTVTEGTVDTSGPPATITLNPTTGIPGKIIAINGTNFDPSATVRIYFGDVDTSKILTVMSDGTFTGNFSIPQKDPGSYTVKVYDNSAYTKTATATFNVLAELRSMVSKNRGAVGTNVNASGKGWQVNSTVIVKYDDKEITGANAVTDSEGAFTIDFKIPVSAAGEHKITVSDGTNTKEYKYLMENTPPSSTVLQTPTADSEISGILYFEWVAVTDDSLPVSYNLQLSGDPSFAQNSIIMEKKGIAEKVYSCTTAEQTSLVPVATAIEPAPKNKTYYWRVQAIDAAGNKGEWSRASTFIMPPAKASTPTTTAPTTAIATKTGTGTGFNVPGNLPGWAIYALVALIALLFLFIGMWIGRKSAYY